MTERAPLTYRDAGVDIDEGERLVDAIRPLAQATRRSECLDSLGGFGALFKLPIDRYRAPVLVSGTDGVGTKLLLARELDKHNTIGIDLVAMCVNDIVVQGAEPLFFLDYFATGKLRAELAKDVVEGIATGCHQAGAALVGGETAEMPGMYTNSDYDLAGFCVGVVEQDQIINGSAIRAGDRVIGLASSGPHSNGYSLIRRIVQRYADESEGDVYNSRPWANADESLGDALLKPTQIYVSAILDVIDKTRVDGMGRINGIAHITGGGIVDNLARVLPDNCQARLSIDSWQRPAVFKWLQQVGRVPEVDMLRTFNCGIGMVVIVDDNAANDVLKILEHNGQDAWEIGQIVKQTDPNQSKVAWTRT